MRITREAGMPGDDRDLGAQLQQIMATLMLQGAMQSALTDALIERKILLPAQVHGIYARALSDLRAAPPSPAPVGSASAGRTRWSLPRGKPLEMSGDLGQGHHVAQIDIDVVQEHLVHELAALAHGLTRHDHAEAVGGVAAGRIDAV